MLEVIVRLNGRDIAHAGAFNTSKLADVSNYDVEGHDLGSAKLGFSNFQFTGKIEKHNRRQSPWALVEKIARLAAPVDGYK